MSLTTFLSNELLWRSISRAIKNASHVDAAIAYLGQGGATLLPLRNGDRLIVDMSPATVKAGGTDPREVKKLIRRGVQVYTRRHLHAKTLVADKTVISGSANVSKRSQQLLDEAGISTNDPSAVRRAKEFIERLSTEPVRPEYLAMCMQLYRSPKPNDVHADGNNSQRRAQHAKLWIVNLRESSISENEEDRYEKGTARAAKKLRDRSHSKPDSFNWPFKPRMADELELGDWIIRVITNTDKAITVYPPGQLLLVDSYVRVPETTKQRYVFHVEVPKRGETLSWAKFREATKSFLKSAILAGPRTGPIRDVKVADRLLALWTPGGRLARRK
jgi:phospholipase D-like protein